MTLRLTWTRSADESHLWKMLKREGVEVLSAQFTSAHASMEAALPLRRLRDIVRELAEIGVATTPLESMEVIG